MVVKIKLWGEEVGLCSIDENNNCAFQYDDNFIKKDICPSPIHMPLTPEVYQFNSLSEETFKGLPGMLADSLPDNWGNSVLNQWAEVNGIKNINAVQKLSYIGSRGMGALEFEPVLNPNKLEQSIALDVSEMVRVASDVVNHRKNFKGSIEEIERIVSVSSSAGGARAKAVIALNETTNEVRSGQVDAPEGFSHWLLKFDGVTNKVLGDPEEYGKIEFCYHKMAKDAGINMTHCRLLEENGRSHFMTKRFDRIGNEKLHMQTLCAIAHMDYNKPREYSYEDAFRIMNGLNLHYNDKEQLFRRAAFNVFSCNNDDHTKNISFLMDKSGEWKLSPAYDLIYSFDANSRFVNSHQMTINGKSKDVSIDDLQQLAKKVGIKNSMLILKEVKHGVDNWNKYAKEVNISSGRIEKINIKLNESYIQSRSRGMSM
jgi:serine/threonine-protein kinase HipA